MRNVAGSNFRLQRVWSFRKQIFGEGLESRLLQRIWRIEHLWRRCCLGIISGLRQSVHSAHAVLAFERNPFAIPYLLLRNIIFSDEVFSSLEIARYEEIDIWKNCYEQVTLRDSLSAERSFSKLAFNKTFHRSRVYGWQNFIRDFDICWK